MVSTTAAISSLLIRPGTGPVGWWARRRASAESLRAWVSVIHPLTTAGSPPLSRAALYWLSCRSQVAISSRSAVSSGERLGGGAAFETGEPRRELISTQRIPVFGDPDDPDAGRGRRISRET